MLNTSEYRRLVNCIHALYDEKVEFRDFPRHAIETTARLIDNDVCSYGEIDTIGRCAATASNHAPSVTPPLVDKWAEYTLAPELLAYWQMFEPNLVMKFSDRLSRTQVEALPIYQEYFARFGVFHQIILPFVVDGGLVLSMGYSRRLGAEDFDERDRALLREIGPHVARAYRRAKSLELAKRDRSMVTCELELTSTAVIAITHHGGVQAATCEARRWVIEFFSDFPMYSWRLPNELCVWVRDQLDPCRGRPREPLVRHNQHARLSVNLAGSIDRDNLTLILKRHRPIANADLAHVLGVTDAEANNLREICRGLTDKQIATRLSTLGHNVTTGTVRKHVQHIREKMGVTNRSEAIAETLRRLSDWYENEHPHD